MIRIRVGASWKHDPAVRAALRRAAGSARAAARTIVDALAIEVDGVDIARGRAEGPLLPSLEALLRATARILSGAPQASVAFGDGDVELVLRRRGPSALLTFVVLDRPARILANGVEVDLEAFAAAALEASATFVRELASAVPSAGGSPPGAHRLHAAARRLRRLDPAPPPRPSSPGSHATRSTPPAGAWSCSVELRDDEGLLQAYPGGRAELGSLLVPGRVVLRGGPTVFAFEGTPFLAVRDLAAAADGIVRALARGDPRYEAAVAEPGGASATLALDLSRGAVAIRGVECPCRPADLARALLEAALGFAGEVRARNLRQAENPYVTELESSASERLAHLDEIEAGDLVGRGADARARTPRAPPRRPLGPGRLRRISFRRTVELDVGAPAGEGLARSGRLVLAAGAAATAALDPGTGRVAWRGEGCAFAAALPGALLVMQDESITCLAPATGRRRWVRPWPGVPPRAALALPRGPFLLVEPGAATGIDPSSGRTLWRFSPPAAATLRAACFGPLAVLAADTGIVYGLDAAGGLAFRLRAPGAPLAVPRAIGSMLLLPVEAGPGTVLLAIDDAGRRHWEATLDLAPAGPPLAWGRRIALAGTIAGDPAVQVLGRDGSAAWTAALPLAGLPAVGLGPALLLLGDATGATVALDGDGASRWTRAGGTGHPPPAPVPPAAARGTVLAGGDGISALDVRTGAPIGAAPGIAPVRLLVRDDLSAAALEADGRVVAFALATHLSVL